MAVLFRIFLVGLLIYLIFQTFASFGARTNRPAGGGKKDDPVNKGDKRRGVPKEIGEYVDYEEVNDD
jgi:hypothetical protein